LDFFRRRVDWFSWVIRIGDRLPFFGGGCGIVVESEMVVNLLMIIAVNGWCVWIR